MYTCAPHPEPSSLLPHHSIPLGCPSAPARSIQHCASNLDWQFVSYMIFTRRPNWESAPLRTTGVPEPERLGPGRYRQPRAGHGWFLAEQPRAWEVWAGRLHVPWAGADPVWLRHCEHTPVLFAASLPPSQQCDWTSEPKKKKYPPPSPLCQGGNQTLKRPANRRSYNRGNCLGSYRQ